MNVYTVRHRTEYRYEIPVDESYGRAHLLPRTAPGQEVRAADVRVTPGADELAHSEDYFGNIATYYAVRTPHRELTVTATSEVGVTRQAPDAASLDRRWDEPGPVDPVLAEYLLPSPMARPVATVTDYADAIFVPGRSLHEILTMLLGRVHADFAYVSGATTVHTTPAQLLERGQGVCQDFAHLAVACLRHAGLPARYVSGYLETDPPPGQAKLQGADASHAWASVHVADAGWIDLDPTNNQFVDARYVVTAWGRDYSDVPPLKGVILTESQGSAMSVSVDVTRIA